MLESFNNNFPESVTPQSQAPTPPPRRRQKHSALAESFFVKYGFKFILGIVVILVFLTVVQCDIKKPEAPTWTTNLTVPMMSRTYGMPEIIDKIDQPGLGFDEDSNIIFSYSSDIDTFNIDAEELRIDDLSMSFSENIGSVDIDLASPPDQSFNLTDLIDVYGGIIPGVGIDIYYDLPSFTEFDWATVATGGFYIVLVNDLGVDLSLVQVDVIDKYYVRTITSPPKTFPNVIPDGGRDSIYVEVTGQTISCQLGIDMHCETPGGTVLTTTDKKMTSSVKLNTLTVTSARAKIPRLTKDLSTRVSIVNDNSITTARLTSGTATLSILNGTALNIDLDVFLPDFTQGGVPLTRHVAAGGNQNQQVVIDLDGYTFAPLDQGFPQNVACSACVVIDSTAPGKATITEGDNIQVNIGVSGVDFSSIEGVLHAAQAQFDSVDLNVDLPRGFDEIQLVNAEMILRIENAFGLDGDVSITVTGDNGQSLVIDATLQAGSVADPSMTIITRNDLADFLNPVPDVISVSGSADFSGAGQLTRDDYVFASVDIESPMEMVIDSATFEGDLTSEEIDQNDIDLITDHVVEARIVSNIENHLPLGASVDIYLGGDSATVLDNPQLIIPLSVDAGTTDAGGNVTDAVSSGNIVTLDSTDIKILKNPTLYTAQIITLQSTDGQTVKINLDDYIHVSAIIEVEYKFDGEF